MAITCNIDFDNNPHGTFFAGQTLAGRITITSNKLKEVKGVALYVNGFAHTEWTERSSRAGARSRRRRRYTGHEDYIATLTYLLGSPGNSQKLRIEPGVHTYTFACQLPITCPSSFEGTYGHVRYKVKVALERPWKFDQTFSRCFTVLKIMDLNCNSPLLRMPASTETQKTYCCWPCASEPMMLQLSLPQTGFVAGQLIPVNVLVTNDSRVPVEELKITLAMVATYYSQSPSVRIRDEPIVVAMIKGDGVMRHCTKNFVYDLRVPATPPSCLNFCRIIEITYQIEVEAIVKGWHRNEALRIPVTIGSVPLYQDVQQQPSRGQHSEVLLVPATLAELPTTSSCTVDAQLVSATKTPNDVQLVVNETLESTASTVSNNMNVAPMPWAADANIPPPNYEEAVHMQHATIMVESSEAGTSRTQDYSDQNFKPLYPVFNVSSPTAHENGANNFAGGYDNNIDQAAGTTSKGLWI